MINNILAAVGVIITIIIGIIGVKYTLKQKNKTQLTFLKHSCISLFKAIVKNLDDIEIKYQGNIIGENLILLKGTIFNNGNADIDKAIVHKPLTLTLPDNYSWINYKVIDSSDGLVVNVKKVENSLQFNWDLLKEREFFSIDCLIEFNSDKKDDEIDTEIDLRRNLLNNLEFKHRITNLKSVNSEESVPSPMPIGGLLFFSLILLSIVYVGFYFSAGQFVFPKYEIYQEVLIDSTLNIAKLKATDDKTIELVNQKGNNILILDAS
ncbi:MAG: hypothetical protein U9R23_08085 [Candidatus Cloacimonadota bacterium]|nr:hypothetical protein [Candidatus Cloacimonadota bacterium]